MRIAAVEAQIEALRGSLGTAPAPDNVQARLDLARILCWRGHNRETQELLEPLTTDRFDSQIAFGARQLVACNHYRHDQYDRASRQYHENLDRARAEGEEYWRLEAEAGIAWVLIDVGHYATPEFGQAEDIFRRILPVYEKRADVPAIGMAMYGISRAAAGKGDYAQALEFASKAIAIFKGTEAENLLQFPLLQLANVHRDRGSFEEARPMYDAAIDAADRSQDPYMQVLTTLSYGMLLRYMNDVDTAIAEWRSVLEPIKELDFPRLGHELCNRLALASAERGEFEDAYRLQLESKEYGNRVGIMSSILNNQQMLLRDHIHQTMQLEDTLNNLRAGVEASVDGIFVLEKPDTGIDKDEFIVRFVNDSAARILGKKPVNVVHVLVSSAWVSDSAKLLLGPSLQVFQTGDPCTLDPIELEFTNGLPRWYSVKIARIPTGVVWTVSDVTDREAMQGQILAQRDSLREANDRLTALDREKSEMLGIAAHDLRSPIGNIRSICELITSDDPLTTEFVNTIEEIANSMLGLIRNLLDVERIERGEMELQLSDLDAGPMVAQIVDQFAAEARQKDIEIEFRIPEAHLPIRADESALHRILQNLISNALKFSPPGSPVAVRALLNESQVRIEIQDRGKGITDADRKKLFNKFARLSARPTAGESSTGLGLSIVKRLVEAMDGQVGCDSEAGDGATFWVEFASAKAGVGATSARVEEAA